ncbi:hypothetical protein BSKO_03216 [Bryopsis sp. KO-2023]|nr:hypothetical protein BSKO_03216 [Bryopsis sp. KO-2023]
MANTVASSSTAPSSTPVDRVPPRHQQEQQLVVCRPMSLNGRRLLRNGSTRKRFDSGDWCLERLGLSDKDSIPFDVPVEKLSPKLSPEEASQVLPPTRSFLLRSAVAPSLVTGH